MTNSKIKMQNAKLRGKYINNSFRKKTSLTFNFEPLTFNFLKNQTGQILVLVFVALGVVLFTVLFIIAGAQIYFGNAKYSFDSEKAVLLAEAGVDKAINSLNKSGGSYNGETETNLGDGSYSVTITSTDPATKAIESTGYIPNKTDARVKRIVRVSTSTGTGIAFNYGVQVGEGGLQLDHGNTIVGSIYSNGNITAVGSGNANTVTGNVWVAGGPQSTADQQTDCEGNNCQDYFFGKTINGETRLDIAQSFKPQTTAVLNKISLKIKKVGNPADVTVRIMGDASGKPDKNNVLATGTLYSSLVTTNYPPPDGWIDVTFTSSPNLVTDTTYWIMIDTSSNSSNYWSWQNDLAQSYTRGQPKWSPNWSASNPTWNNLTAGGDFSFKTYMGGFITSLRSIQGEFNVSDDVHANTIDNIDIGGDAYYQTITNSTVQGDSFPGTADPPPKVFPISEANITQWKSETENRKITNGDITTCPAILEGKIVGNVTWDNGCTVIIKSNVWITGNFTIENNNVLRLDSSYGSTSGMIIVDGKVDFKNNNHVEGTGVGSSILMVLSTYNSTQNNIAAIIIKNNGNTGVFYANDGIIEPGNNNNFKELTAWGIRLVANSILIYETGLSGTLFSSGPTGSYSLVKGTYQVK